MVLGRHGYETAVEGKNGFVCIVERAWMGSFDSPEFWNGKNRGPSCFNPQAARSVLPITLKRTDFALAELSKDQIMEGIKKAYQNKELPSVEPGAMTYMMSKQGRLNDRAGHWVPHLMFYVSVTDNMTWEWDSGWLPRPYQSPLQWRSGAGDRVMFRCRSGPTEPRRRITFTDLNLNAMKAGRPASRKELPAPQYLRLRRAPMKERTSPWAVAFVLLFTSVAACAQDACERLAAAKIPNTTITLAQTVAARAFTALPRRKAAANSRFCIRAFRHSAASLPRRSRLPTPTSNSKSGFRSPDGMASCKGSARADSADRLTMCKPATSLKAGYTATTTDTGHTGSPIDSAWPRATRKKLSITVIAEFMR